MLKHIPCIYMRAGTSRGPFLDLRDLPSDTAERAEALLKIMGSPDKRQIDGIGGATTVTSKVVMVQPSERAGIDVDYLFAQVFIEKPIVDTKPTCGNMMTGVGPFAIEKGWVKATHPETRIKVYNFNTDSHIEIVVQTPHGEINYVDGDFSIDGVPGSGAPVLMNLSGIAGGATGKLFPTGNRVDTINGLEVSLVDAGNMMMLLRARDLGLTGLEDKAFFQENKELMQRIEATRIEAGRISGLGDVSESVIPKVGILSPPRNGGNIKSQYLTPHSLHPAHAVSGAVCIGTAAKAEGTIAAEIAQTNGENSEQIVVEHPSGLIPVQIEVGGEGKDFNVVKAGTLRTCRKLMEGQLFY
ncbi:MAG: 4-oxalomesaconate tautomerase [Bacteroidota bacterium]